MKKFVACLMVATAAACSAQDFMCETFDGYLLGPVSSYSGWGQTNDPPILTNTQPAQVTNVRPATSPNSLLFAPPSAGKQCTLAMYTNLNAYYSYTDPNHPVLRTSFMLYKENARQNFAFLQGLANTEMGLLTDTNDGTIIVNATDTGIPFVTGRYAEVVYLYNMSNNDSCVQYDGTNIADWTGADAPSLTQIVYTAFYRLPDPYAGAPLYVDQVHVDKPTPGTVAWWRFDTAGTNSAGDHAGLFKAARLVSMDTTPKPPASTPLYDGWQDRSDAQGRRSFKLDELNPWRDTGKMPEWTLEAIMAAEPGAVDLPSNFQLLHWGTGIGGGSSTNSEINFVWLRLTGQFSAYLRDAQQTNNSIQYLTPLGRMPADGQWHHVAFVKTGSWLHVYTDYRPTIQYPLDAASTGYYSFATSSHAGIGVSLNNGNHANTNQWLDELRFTARALPSSEFLQWGQPLMVSAPDPAAPSWNLDVLSISGRTYNVQTAPSPGSSTWSDVLPGAIATGHYSTLTIPATTNRILRAVRQ
ncbi:MAG TPA: hypothetical protein P5567_05405 [Kiritimatiellia bacterium]|nr:hypothetical protein [Kiritimatiellia bacterium]HRZ11874.1 hypothetical protein [Kiritimatiellia bacterium]HSA17320.1 hypothetical protein [Kiritimatiellia bacterium]